MTEGSLKVTEESFKHSALTKNLIYAIEKKSIHPIAKSIVTAFDETDDSFKKQTEFQVVEINEVQGSGIIGMIKHKNKDYRICLGNLNFIATQTKSPKQVLESARKTINLELIFI